MIKIADVTLAHCQEILRLYAEIIRKGEIRYLTPEELLREIQNGKAFFDGYRIGSYWDPHSKIRFRRTHDGLLQVGFNENFDLRERKESNPSYVEARSAGEYFVEKANALS